MEAIQTLRPEYATNPELFAEGEPLYAFDLVNQVFLENPNPEAVPESDVVMSVVLVGLAGLWGWAEAAVTLFTFNEDKALSHSRHEAADLCLGSALG